MTSMILGYIALRSRILTQIIIMKATFLTISEFKSAISAEVINIVKNPNTGKLFLSVGDKSFKCQQDIQLDKPLRFVFEESFDDGCLCNVKESDNVIATL